MSEQSRAITRTAAAPLTLLLAAVLAGGLGGCAQRSCANYSVLDYLDSLDRRTDLTHVDLVRQSAVTRPGPAPEQARCAIVERRRVPGTTRIVSRWQYYAIRLDNNGWVMDR